MKRRRQWDYKGGNREKRGWWRWDEVKCSVHKLNRKPTIVPSICTVASNK